MNHVPDEWASGTVLTTIERHVAAIRSIMRHLVKLVIDIASCGTLKALQRTQPSETALISLAGQRRSVAGKRS